MTVENRQSEHLTIRWELSVEAAIKLAAQRAAAWRATNRLSILVASAPTLLARTRVICGPVGRSYPTIGAGAIRRSGFGLWQMCYWKVRVWHRDGNPSVWSAQAQWSMGLLNPSDWTASWIGMTTDTTSLRPPKSDAAKTFTVSKPVARATAYICGLGYTSCRSMA